MPQSPLFYQGMKNEIWSWREDVGFIHTINAFSLLLFLAGRSALHFKDDL
jgi:hypothetical protein